MILDKLRIKSVIGGRRPGVLIVCCILILGLCGGSSTHGQEWAVNIFMQPFPSPYLSDFERNPTNGSLSITNNSGSAAEIIVSLTVARTQSGVIAHGQSNPMSAPAGSTIQLNSDRFIDWGSVSYDGSYRDEVLRTGRLPEGDYSACVEIYNINGSLLAAAVCASFTIVYPSPPSLVFPLDGDTFSSNFPLFTWTPLSVPPGYQLQYILRIAEVFEGQTTHQALLANIPQYENDLLMSSSFQYPMDALPLEAGKRTPGRCRRLIRTDSRPRSIRGEVRSGHLS